MLKLKYFSGKNIRVVHNSNRWMCPSNTLEETIPPTCSVDLKLDSNNNPCTLGGSYSRNNQTFCFGENVVLHCENNVCQCFNGKNYTLSQLKQQCGDTFDTSTYVQYDYYPNSNGKGISIAQAKNLNICQNEENNHCLWHSDGYSFLVKRK